MEITFGASGHFSVRRLRDGRVAEERGFQNLILDNGLAMLAGTVGVNPWEYCRVGAGTSTESATQTSLDAQVGSAGVSGTPVTGLNTAEGYIYWRGTYTWAVGAVVGNISEVGVGTSWFGNTLFSRALVKDLGGLPTTITVLEDEQLQVVYEHRLYLPTGDMFTGSVGGYSCVLRPASNLNSEQWAFDRTVSGRNAFGAVPAGDVYAYYNGDIGAASGIPSGSSAIVDVWSASFLATPVSTGVVDAFFRAPIGSANLAGGVRSVLFRAGPGRFQCQFDPAIPKTSADRLDLKFRFSVTRRT